MPQGPMRALLVVCMATCLRGISRRDDVWRSVAYDGADDHNGNSSWPRLHALLDKTAVVVDEEDSMEAYAV